MTSKFNKLLKNSNNNNDEINKIFFFELKNFLGNKCKVFCVAGILIKIYYFTVHRVLSLPWRTRSSRGLSVAPGKETNNMVRVIYIISYTFLGILIYLFVEYLSSSFIYNIFQITIFSVFSFAIFIFISDKFKLSNNKFIKILQIFVFIYGILTLIGLILFIFDISTIF